MTMTLDPPPDDTIVKKLTPGNRTERRYRAGRVGGVRNLRTRETDELLKQLKYDPPHIALLKLANDEKFDLALRTQCLAWAAPYFGSKYAATPPSRFITESPELGELTDAASAVRFVARIAEQVQAGRLDLEWAQFFSNLAALFASLRDKRNWNPKSSAIAN